MNPKLIKTSTQHLASLKRLEELMLADPKPGSPQADEMELLAFLLQDYERRKISIPAATPVEAIKFRMEQAGLKQQDLVAVIGSKARVSEILSGKRELTLAMVRGLYEGLGIPLASLVKGEVVELPPEIDPCKYPVKEMFLRGYFAAAFGSEWIKVKERAEELLHAFFGGRENDPICALNRQTTTKKNKVDLEALHAWRCRVLDMAGQLELPAYDPDAINDAFIQQLTVLSRLSNGPLLVQQQLREAGIAMITEEHLPGTHLDGAAMWHPKGFPVIALTLRHNRLDNFWFTLFHELGHVIKHLGSSPGEGFIDTDIDSASEKEIEREADQFALNSFIPPEIWHSLGSLHYADEIKLAAKRLAIHPAIIAGRLRREAGDYRKHRTLIGQNQVRELFAIHKK
ncbi:MAG: ImmA/IrrE family metallo-endopeptidase [Proteobacteria bacterium]|nr:MAG: ImmA/IrrE family metallo-endopeptidase [Pseudomonadota bacterium]